MMSLTTYILIKSDPYTNKLKAFMYVAQKGESITVDLIIFTCLNLHDFLSFHEV